jgi:mRNA interferase HigB
MRIISRKALRECWTKHPDAEQALRAWYDDVRRASWRAPSDIKAVYRNASFVGNNRVVFNIKGNNYRLIAAINYRASIVFVRFVGTHNQYDRIDAATI